MDSGRQKPKILTRSWFGLKEKSYLALGTYDYPIAADWLEATYIQKHEGGNPSINFHNIVNTDEFAMNFMSEYSI